jgi:transcriptional regulator of arginine metabolism
MKSAKEIRLETIREIINSGSGSSQEEIRDFLRSRDIDASQATLSRDLREMGAVKFSLDGGKAVYRLHATSVSLPRRISSYDVRFETVGSLLIIKTSPGSAPGLCVTIDRIAVDGIAGTIAGDDTILAVLRKAEDASAIIQQLEKRINMT